MVSEAGPRPMKWAIKAVTFANGQYCPHIGQYLESFDFDAFDGRGHGVFTKDKTRAMSFDQSSDAWLFWNSVSPVKPKRDDGHPNRPLTALTVVIEQV